MMNRSIHAHQYHSILILYFCYSIAFLADLATDQWPDLNGVKDVYFRGCSMNINPHYQIKGLMLTSNPPDLGDAAETESPTQAPTEAPTLPHWPIFSSVLPQQNINLNNSAKLGLIGKIEISIELGGSVSHDYDVSACACKHAPALV